MWTLNCGCVQIDNTYKEEKIINQKILDREVILPPRINDDYCRLKEKIIYEYIKIIDDLECGIKPDLEFLLEEISLIYNINNILN